jgi:hypothetical protein
MENSKVSSQQGGLYDKLRLDGCVPDSSHPSCLPKISSIFVRARKFTGMPFRLDIAPRVFTKIMKLVVASLRSQGVLLIIYLDDILTIVSSVEILNLHKKLAIDLLEPLGFLINYKKSNLISFQQIVFLGMLVDLASMQFVLPQIKVVQIQKNVVFY